MDAECSNNAQCMWLNAGNTLGGDLFRTLKFETALRAMQLLNFNATVSLRPKKEKITGERRNYIRRSVIICTVTLLCMEEDGHWLGV
jgi:hypothetical protein